MNSNDVNSVINNLCDKLGTTAGKLIPEMAGYQIAKYAVLMAISFIFIGVAIGFAIKLRWMKKNDQEMLALYPELVKKLDEKLKEGGMIDNINQWSRMEWQNIVDNVRQVKTTLHWDESTWCVMIMTAASSGLIGIVIFGVALFKLIGWHLAPHAMTVMWIINQLGGMQ